MYTFDYFKTKEAEYFIYNGKHYKHLFLWDKMDGFKYHNMEISASEYVREYNSI